MFPNFQLAFLAILAILSIGADFTMTDAELLTTISSVLTSPVSAPYTTPTTTLSTQQRQQEHSLNLVVNPLPSSSVASTQQSASSSSSSVIVTDDVKHLSLSAGTRRYTAPATSITAHNNININNNNMVVASSSLSSLKSATTYIEHKSVTDMNVTVQIGNHAYLPCNVKSLAGKPVSWVRVRDGHILTVDLTLFIADERFQAIYHEISQKWSLQIKYSQPHDMGMYECQVSSEPKKSSRVFLNVVVPKTELIGDHNRFVKAGSKVALHCIVLGSIEPPSYIIWYKGNQQIIQDNKNGWYMQIDREIFGNSSDQQNTIGSLIIPSVTKRDSGNYTCSPSNSASVTVDLHVLNGEYSASAIMSTAVRRQKSQYFLLISLLMALFSALKVS